MNLRLDENGVRVRLSPAELIVLSRSGEISTTFPLGEKAAWSCGLKVGAPLALSVNPYSIMMKIPKEMLHSLEGGVASGKKIDHEVSQPFEGVNFCLEVDYFQSRNNPAKGEERKLNEHR